MPELLNHHEAKPPFSASNYKKVSPQPPLDGHTLRVKESSGHSGKGSQRPAKTSNSVEQVLGKQENTGSRQTHLIRSTTSLREEERQDMFDSAAGPSTPPANPIGLGCWLLCLLSLVAGAA